VGWLRSERKIEKKVRMGDSSKCVRRSSAIVVNLQVKHFVDELLLFMNEKAATVRLPRHDIVHPVGL
jgi:hypothetical protein